MAQTCPEHCECDDCTGSYSGPWYGHPPLRNAMIALVIAGTGLILGHLGIISPQAENIFFILAIPIGAYHWAREGIEELIKEHEIGIEILMLAATVGCVVLDLWDEAAALVILYAAAEGVEELTYARTRASIRALLDLAPKEAVLLKNGSEITVPATEVRAGDLFLVRPGAGIPTDGVIVKGASAINEAAVTGESVPVEKRVGMNVYAASINGEGALEIRATATFENNTLAKIIHLVEEAHEQKGRTQLFIERFGKKYTPAVLLVSLILIVVPPFFGIPFNDLAIRGVVLLVAAAPCALVMSTPVAIATGIGAAGKSGILIKGGAHLESLGKIRAIAFDKTGTLTTGIPAVTDIVALDGTEKDVLQIAYSVEKCSEHPLAKAINRRAEQDRIEALEAANLCALTGQGAAATISGIQYIVGKPESFTNAPRNAGALRQIGAMRADGKTAMVVGTGTKMIGIIAVRDQVRPEAKAMIDRLRSMGIAVVMLTGDNAVTARVVAMNLGIDEMRADLKPEDKIAAIEELKTKYGSVAMIGDGINDAPALARATVGIAMGTIGTDAAIEAADVALMADDLTKVPEAIGFGRNAVKIGNQNIVFSLAVLAIMIPAAVLGLLGVTLAVIIHEASELLAVGNGLRLAKRE
ncbi:MULTISPECIES: cation-translocating P-type ATPase [unclassified Methanoregula]|uniref:heavy metal translocating P-type ATPase n=1 Tax=unclassified Methanoregula TaxID=2649730 RepID=UPI0009C7FC0F|nr:MULTISPECIES: heavy metal translocating P-type ATPase [unclassified Methanoregula]OPX64971.1 MAG: putative copper-exporting P-type ATPase A [Methanoregula sp. PtaB.Bin085]OPY35093.1 MAG: putative copper-exporting P-type ATPase A [Methanoregula sp. PtaU1.Bin006]